MGSRCAKWPKISVLIGPKFVAQNPKSQISFFPLRYVLGVGANLGHPLIFNCSLSLNSFGTVSKLSVILEFIIL